MILVVDSTDRERLSITKEELHKMMGHDELSRANILVFANKQVYNPNLIQSVILMLDVSFCYGIPDCNQYFLKSQDVNGCMSAAEISKQLNLQSMRKHKWQIQACCALSGEGLYQGLEWIVNNIKKR